ncbi:putative reverse transcriptase domain-containing protein [Tanacetum coccineum]
MRKSLAIWGKYDGITTLVKSILDGSALGSFGQGGGDFLEEGATGNTNIKQCLRKVADGHFTAAVKVISSSGVAPYCNDTIKALEAKHPYKPPPSMPSITFSKPPLVAKIDSVSLFWHRKCSKSTPLLPFRCYLILGVLHRVLSEYHNDGSLAMQTVDFSNAFNLVDRSALLYEVRVKCPSISLWVDFLYGQASRLCIGDTHIWSATRVHQGDPFGTSFFALILHPLLHTIKDSCKLLLHAWYLDDETVIGDLEEVARVLDIIKVNDLGLDLKLNIKKTEIFWPSCNGMKLHEGLFPDDIRRSSSGVKLLRGAISRDADYISGLAMRRVANAVDLMGLLPQLHDPQSELLLLRSCMGIAKLFFGLRTCQYVHMEGAALFFDKALRDQSWVLQDHILRDSGICDIDDDYVSALACLCDTIPSFDFGGFTNKDIVPSKAQQTLANVIFSEMVKYMEVHFDMTMR